MERIIEHFSDLNWLAVLVAGLANFIVGALWYQPFSFGGKWAAAHGIDVTKAKEGASMGKVMAIGFITTMLTAVGAAYFIPSRSCELGMGLGLVMGIFVVFFNMVKHNNFLMKPSAATLIDGGHDVVVFTLMGAIIGCM
jgi:hypothetical protein